MAAEIAMRGSTLSTLAYLVWVSIAAAANFVGPAYAWRSFPIIDSHRFAASR